MRIHIAVYAVESRGAAVNLRTTQQHYRIGWFPGCLYSVVGEKRPRNDRVFAVAHNQCTVQVILLAGLFILAALVLQHKGVTN